MIDRKRWGRDIEIDGTGWICPSCHRGGLTFRDEDFRIEETASSRGQHDEPHWDLNSYAGRFVCLLRCSSCNDPTVVAGDVFHYEDPDGCGRYCRPRFVFPSPDLFHIPDKCPEIIKEEIRRSFVLFWTDNAACLNRIRCVVEMLLTRMGVRRFSVSKANRRERIKLHHRIEDLRGKHPSLHDLCDHLLAVKWLGNEGSHCDEVTRDTVFDAYDMLESTLRQLYDKSHIAVARVAKIINRKRGSR